MAPSHLLLDSLLRGALAVTQLHFLVLTDAQNIKNQDSHSSLPIVQVMNDFYRVTDPLSRPRIFALVSPPADRRSHFDSKMLKLEQTLDAKVFGVTEEKRTEILALPDRPNEIVILYDTAQRATETRLLKQLHQLDPTESVFRRHYHASRYTHEEVGSCASDLVWRRGLKAIESDLVPGYADIDEEDSEIPAIEGIKIKMYNIVKNWPFTMPNLDASSRGFNVSHKFLRLVQVLSTFKSYGEGFRGIIFVQRHAIALVLADLLRTLDDRLGFLRPHAIVGFGHHSDPTYYQGVFQRFATGVCNLLIATKSIEDLDIPKASVVIRYDLFESQVSHAYVRARTRGRESHLIHMVERGNDMHRRILSRITNLDADMLRWTETLCNSPESSVPPKSLRETINPYHSDSEAEDEEEPQNFIKDPTTGGRIYLQDATTVIYRYAANIRSRAPGILDHQRIFEFKDIHKEFGIPRAHICSINLPGTPIHKVASDDLPSKAQARRSTCFKACEKLYNLGLLDCQLVPLPHHLRAQHEYERRKAFEKDSIPEVKAPGTRAYPRKQPAFWENNPSGIPTVLYPTIISIANTIEGTEAFGPLVLLTREPLPDLPSFRLFFSGIAIHICFQKASPLHLDEVHMKDLHAFTVRICRAIMNKALTCSLEEMTYFFLPMPLGWRSPPDSGLGVPDIMESIPWELVSLAAQHWAVPIKHSSPEELEADLQDAVIQDRWIEFTRRYKVVKIRNDLTPLSKPADSPREASYENLFEFCKSKRKGLETLSNFEQPIIEVAKVHAILNHLNPTSKPPSSSNKSPAKYLIPELCAKFTLSASTLWTAMLLPSIMRRINDLLLVKELDARFFDHAVREDLLHIAICAPSAGLEYDYERLELLGDAFLKYLSSIYVFVTNPSLTEGALHVARQKIISNKSLLQHSTRVGLPAYIQSKVFAYKAWQPPNFRVYIPPKTPREPDNKSAEQSNAGDKEEERERSPNDSVDAQEATAVDNEQVEDAPLVQANGTSEASPMLVSGSRPLEHSNDPATEILEEDSFSETGGQDPDAGASQSATPTATAGVNGISEPARKPRGSASKRKSKGKGKGKKGKSDEQAIQWLGDKAIADVAEAIIGAAYISGGREAALQATKALTIPLSNVDRWSDFGRKVLTPPPNVTAKLKSGSIAAIEKIIGHKFNRPHLLGQAMTHSSIQGYESTSYERLEFIGDAILDFMVIRHIFDRDQQLSPGALTMLKGAMVSNSALAAVCVCQQKEYALADEEGRSPGQYWLDIEPPKALSDVVESIAGAIYISDNFDPVGAESLFDNVLKPFYDKHITLQTLSHHPTKILFELLQAQGCQQFEITKDKDENIIRCNVVVHDIVLASAEDTTPTSAARLASFFALDALEGDADFMTKTCDCRSHHTHKKTHQKTDFEKALEKALGGGINQ
ncbi:hypothetical protein BDZ97DRAFT_3979 [Flammula alnicola]|nr:hypothetical protein BDZ97DRAFT_3979 [Flammula alnicola]